MFSKVKLSDYNASNPLRCESNKVLVSGNPNKGSEIAKILTTRGGNTQIGVLPLNLEESQGDIGKQYEEVIRGVTLGKVRDCWRQVWTLVKNGVIELKGKTLFIIEDSSFFLLASRKHLPGHLIKGVEPDELIALANGFELQAIDEAIARQLPILDESAREGARAVLRAAYFLNPPSNLTLNGVHPRAARAVSQFACFSFDPSKIDTYNPNTLDERNIIIVDGSCTGKISRELRGKGGFAWDWVFEPDAETLLRLGSSEEAHKHSKRTFGEMIDEDPNAKNSVSQRFDATIRLHDVINAFDSTLPVVVV